MSASERFAPNRSMSRNNNRECARWARRCAAERFIDDQPETLRRRRTRRKRRKRKVIGIVLDSVSNVVRLPYVFTFTRLDNSSVIIDSGDDRTESCDGETDSCDAD